MKNLTKFLRAFLACFVLFPATLQAAEKPSFRPHSVDLNQSKMTQFLKAKPRNKAPDTSRKPLPPPTRTAGIKRSIIDLTEAAPPPVPVPVQKASSKAPTSMKQTLPQVSAAKRTKPLSPEMSIRFLQGTDDHTQAYADCIDKAETDIIIASWNLNFIPEQIFRSLMAAKKRGVYINFVVNSVKREATLDCFDDEDDDEDDEPETRFQLFETKSHAKFLFVDRLTLILGSFNALGESFEEANDASFMIRGTVNQLWPFYMSIYETYTSIGEDLGSIFDGTAMISKSRNPGERRLLQRSFEDGSRITLLRTLKEHEDFFKHATPHSGRVTIYSPFSTKDNTLKRLKTLEKILPPGTEVHLRVLKDYESGLKRLLSLVPGLQNHARVDVATFHRKVVIVGDSTFCLGSLNWLSAAQDANDAYLNVELSLVLQGPKAEEIIRHFYD